MELMQNQRQIQTLSPQMVQSMKILQMGVQELREYVEDVLQENPVLELPEPDEISLPTADFAQKLEWLEANDRQNVYYHYQDAEDAVGNALEKEGDSWNDDGDFSWYVLSQFMGTDLEPEVMKTIEFLVDRLDSNGFLDEDCAALTHAAGVSETTMHRALTELQAADPAGVGAHNVAECLRLQIERRAGDHRLAIRIVEQFLDELAHGRYGLISRKLGAPEREIRAECDLIRTLHPYPGTGFASQEHLAYITPDVKVIPCADHFEIVINDALVPHLKTSRYYHNLLHETEDPEVRDYLTQKMSQAKGVVESIDGRRSMLLQCVQWVVKRQEDFFRQGSRHLHPLTMAEIARNLNVHESTISRAVRDKYLQCDQGVYPLSYFFSRALGNEHVSPESAKALLKHLIETEKTTLSDQKLCEEMARQGCPLSRRTVTKYREELGIPNASGRKHSKIPEHS